MNAVTDNGEIRFNPPVKSRGWAHEMDAAPSTVLAIVKKLPFWEMHYALYDESSVNVRGTHYRIGPEKGKGFRGFGGGKFVVKFFDGRVVTTTNLWCQGEISPEYRDRLPNNAEFEGAPFGEG
jgi:hypothetical protein